MPVNVVPPSEATGRLKGIYDEIVSVMGEVPPALQVLSASPGALETYWGTVKNLYSQIRLSRKEMMMVAFEVAKADGCPVCKDASQTQLHSIGMSAEEIAILDREIKETTLDERTKNILVYSYAIASNPHDKDKAVNAFKALGLTDSELVDIAAATNGNKALFGMVHSLGFHA